MSRERMTAAEYRKRYGQKPYDGAPAKNVGGSWRTIVAQPTTINGVRFPSKAEAATWPWLKLKHPDAVILRQVPLHLTTFDSPSAKVILWRIDFMVLDPSGVYQEAHDPFNVTIYDSKGSKAAEGRDFRLKLAGYYASGFPWPFVLCRLVRGKIVTQDGRELI